MEVGDRVGFRGMLKVVKGVVVAPPDGHNSSLYAGKCIYVRWCDDIDLNSDFVHTVDNPTAYGIESLCKCCDELREDHMPSGKCLFAPTSWR